MITSSDICQQVDTIVQAGGADLAEGIDVDAITTEIVQTYGLVDIDTIEHDEFWSLVARHDVTQQVEITVTAVAPYGQEQRVISRERATWPVDLSGFELSAQDLGCAVGAEYRVAVLDSDGAELVAVDVFAR